MTLEIKAFAATLATMLAIFAYVPYLIDMFRGKNKPHLYTWITIFLVTIVVAYMQVVGGGGIGAIPVIIGAAFNGVILFYCFKFGTRDVVFIDKLCLTISIIGVILFALLYDYPLVSLAIVTIAEITSFIPTFRKTWNDPYSESLPSYYLLMLKLALVLVALESHNLLTASYSILWIVVFVCFLSMVYLRRAGYTKKPHVAQDSIIGV
jgi:hypothetical protein